MKIKNKKLKSNALNVIFHISYFWVLQKYFPKIFFQFFFKEVSEAKNLNLDNLLMDKRF